MYLPQNQPTPAPLEPVVPDETPNVDAGTSQSTATGHSDEGPLDEQSIRFVALPKWQQNQIKAMHRNLGHPSNDRLARALQLAGQRPEVVQAARELRCPICAKHAPPSHQRPGHLKALMDFNHKVYIDGISWSNQAGKSIHFISYD